MSVVLNREMHVDHAGPKSVRLLYERRQRHAKACGAHRLRRSCRCDANQSPYMRPFVQAAPQYRTINVVPGMYLSIPRTPACDTIKQSDRKDTSLPDAVTLSTTITGFMSAVLIPTGAAIAAFLAWRVARDKLKLDLYDRRFAIYDAALDYYFLKDGQHAGSDPETIERIKRKCIKACREAQFLFDESSGVVQALNRVRRMTDGSQPKLMEDLEAAMAKFIHFGKRRSGADRILGVFFEAD